MPEWRGEARKGKRQLRKASAATPQQQPPTPSSWEEAPQGLGGSPSRWPLAGSSDAQRNCLSRPHCQ
eukprot:9275879-Prorocentrum_lima.AAC.1